MKFLRLIAVFGCFAVLFARTDAAERNYWPGMVEQLDAADHVASWEAAGPFLFEKPAADQPGSTVGGFRPFFVRTQDATGMTTEATSLYPIFIYRADSDQYQWSVFNLINRGGPKHGVSVYRADQTEALDVWPFYFSRQTGAPETSYRALFPIAGEIKGRFWHDDLQWVLFPLYLHSERAGAVTTSVPWPFIRVTRGTEDGFALWPLFGYRDQTDRFHRSFWLWPLGWNNTIQPKEDAPAGTEPTRQTGFIPFFTRETRPGYVDQSFVWPFFGYTDRTVPATYHETRYLWPFLVQGRGDHYVNRWGPVYTHSIVKGVDKQWYLWPILKRTHWQDGGIDQVKTQFLYVVYFSNEQRSLTNPNAAPADRTHLWPLFSKWDNGAGRRQFQLFSPLDIFFPTNERVRNSWTPLFAIYRSDVRSPEERRGSILWSAVSWKRDHDEREFHLGPLFSVESDADAKRVAIGNGILGWKRAPGTGRWSLFWFDFPSKPRKLTPATR